MEMMVMSIGVLGFFFYLVLNQFWMSLRYLGKTVPRWLPSVVLSLVLLSIVLHLIR